MSTADVFPYSVAQQKTLISADLNTTLLLQFLFGIYTGIYLATMYVYSHKENRTRARDMIIIGSTGALYFLTALIIVLNGMFYTNIIYCTKGATRVDMFIGILKEDTPLGVYIISDVMSFMVYLFADGLLVWRCFHACGRSFRRASLPIVLLTVETVLVVTTTVNNCLFQAKPELRTAQVAAIDNHITATAYITVFATSLFSTGIICRQIWQHTSPSSRSRKHYKTIINALIQSSAIYTVTVLIQAILYFVDTGNLNTQSIYTNLLIIEFVAVAVEIAPGLVPTLMIARLVLSSSEEDNVVSSAYLPSDLISRAPHATGANITNVGTDLEMQQQRRSSFAVGEQESEEIQVAPRKEYHGKPEDALEDGLIEPVI